MDIHVVQIGRHYHLSGVQQDRYTMETHMGSIIFVSFRNTYEFRAGQSWVFFTAEQLQYIRDMLVRLNGEILLTTYAKEECDGQVL